MHGGRLEGQSTCCLCLLHDEAKPSTIRTGWSAEACAGDEQWLTLETGAIADFYTS